jgi:hypothetical protein
MDGYDIGLIAATRRCVLVFSAHRLHNLSKAGGSYRSLSGRRSQLSAKLVTLRHPLVGVVATLEPLALIVDHLLQQLELVWGQAGIAR